MLYLHTWMKKWNKISLPVEKSSKCGVQENYALDFCITKHSTTKWFRIIDYYLSQFCVKADSDKWFWVSPTAAVTWWVRLKLPEDFFIFTSGVWARLAGTFGGWPGISFLLFPHGWFGLPHSMAISGMSHLAYGGWLFLEPVF